MQSNITYHSKYGPFAPKGTIQINPDIATSRRTQTRKYPYHYLQGQMRETDWTPTSGHLQLYCSMYYLFIERRQNTVWPHNLSASFWEYNSKCRESEVSMSDVYLFLLEHRKSIIYLGGSIIQDNGHNVVREHLLLLARIYTFYRVLMFRIG